MENQKPNQFFRFGFFAFVVCSIVWVVYTGPRCDEWASKRFWRVVPAARVVQKCLSEGADIGARDENGLTPLHLLVESRFSVPRVFRLLRSKGADAEIVQLLLDAGADMEARDFKHAATPLHFALLMDSPHILQSLLDAGADIEARNDDGLTPMHIVAGTASVDNVHALVDAGADIEARTNIGLTPLMVAATLDSAEIVLALVEIGADINAQEDNGITSLHLAAAFGSAETVKALVDAGADPAARARDGSLPADWAALNDRVRNRPVFMELKGQSN